MLRFFSGMWEELFTRIWERVEKEWPVIRQAPVTFGLALGLGGIFIVIAVWFAMWWHYEGTISALRATNELLEKQLQSVPEKVDRTTERVDLSSQADISPCRLQSEQKDSLIQRLRGRSEGRVVTIQTLEDPETEPRQYAEDFIEVFTVAGWEVRRDLYPGLKATPVLVFSQ